MIYVYVAVGLILVVGIYLVGYNQGQESVGHREKELSAKARRLNEQARALGLTVYRESGPR